MTGVIKEGEMRVKVWSFGGVCFNRVENLKVKTRNKVSTLPCRALARKWIYGYIHSAAPNPLLVTSKYTKTTHQDLYVYQKSS